MSTPPENIERSQATPSPLLGTGNGILLRVSLGGLNEFILEWDRPDLLVIEEGKVQRSQYQNGPWTTIGSTDTLQFLDTPIDPLSRFRNWFYRIVYPDTILGPESLVKGVDKIDPGDRGAVFAAWMARRHMARIGERGALFAAPSQGSRCPECWDPVTGARRKSKCQTCDGTGYASGASSPLPLQASFGKEQSEAQRIQSGKVGQSQVSITLSNFPRIKKGDFIVRYSDRAVFEVIQNQPTYYRSYIIRQNIITRLSERGSLAEAYAAIL